MVIGRKLISEAAKYVSFLGELWRKYIGEASCSWRPCFSLYTLPHLIPLPISTPTLPKPSSVSFLLSSDQSSSFSVSKFSKIWTKENVLKSQWMPEVVEFSRNKCLGWGFVFLWDIRGKNGDGEGLNTRIKDIDIANESASTLKHPTLQTIHVVQGALTTTWWWWYPVP